MKGHSEKTFVSFCSCAIMSAYLFFYYCKHVFTHSFHLQWNLFAATLFNLHKICNSSLLTGMVITESHRILSSGSVSTLLSRLQTWTCSTGTPIDGAVGSRRNGRGGGGGGWLSQHLKLRQKCGKATVSKSTGQLISGTVPTDVPAFLTVCVFTFAGVKWRLLCYKDYHRVSLKTVSPLS